MLTPQEIEVWYILPAIRRELALKLKATDMNQKQIAEIMDITPAAISQYIHNKRAHKLCVNINKEIISNATKDIIKNPNNYAKIIQDILKKIANKTTICKVHKSVEKVTHCCGLCEK